MLRPRPSLLSLAPMVNLVMGLGSNRQFCSLAMSLLLHRVNLKGGSEP